jgi:hypothetical protein
VKLNSLATLYANLDAYGEFESLLLRAVAIKKKMQGLDHPDTATSLVGITPIQRTDGRETLDNPAHSRGNKG